MRKHGRAWALQQFKRAIFLAFAENSKNRALELFRLGQDGLEACGSLEGLERSKSSSARFLSFSGAENSKNRALELFRLGQEGLEACGSLEGLGRSKSSNARFLSFSGAENSQNLQGGLVVRQPGGRPKKRTTRR